MSHTYILHDVHCICDTDKMFHHFGSNFFYQGTVNFVEGGGWARGVNSGEHAHRLKDLQATPGRAHITPQLDYTATIR